MLLKQKNSNNSNQFSGLRLQRSMLPSYRSLSALIVPNTMVISKNVCSRSNLRGLLLLSVALLVLPLASIDGKALIEPERQLEYQRRGYQWPLVDYVPNTTGWRTLMQERFHQVEEMEEVGQRWQAFFQVMNSAFVAPNFTEHGFGLARAPMELVEELQRGIREGLETATDEEVDGTINGPQPPLIVHRRDLVDKVLQDLKPYAEEWSGQKLVAHGAYGFRLYRNQSQLLMHVDRLQTHVISLILHIDSENAKPWPIFIEDFQVRAGSAVEFGQ